MLEFLNYTSDGFTKDHLGNLEHRGVQTVGQLRGRHK